MIDDGILPPLRKAGSIGARWGLPSGNLINLEGIPGADLSGFAGATGKANHYAKLAEIDRARKRPRLATPSRKGRGFPPRCNRPTAVFRCPLKRGAPRNTPGLKPAPPKACRHTPPAPLYPQGGLSVMPSSPFPLHYGQAYAATTARPTQPLRPALRSASRSSPSRSERPSPPRRVAHFAPPLCPRARVVEMAPALRFRLGLRCRYDPACSSDSDPPQRETDHGHRILAIKLRETGTQTSKAARSD